MIGPWGIGNIAAAAAIMRAYLAEAHGNLILAVGWYHSHAPARGLAYRVQVLRAAEKLFVRGCRDGHCG